MMINKEIFKLKLNNKWSLFNGSEFVNIDDNEFFKLGDVLRKNSNYFYISPNGLDLIPKNIAYKKMILYAVRNLISQPRIDSISKRKCIIYIQSSNREEIAFVVRKGDPFLKLLRSNRTKIESKMDNKSMVLLDTLVKMDNRLNFISNGYLEVNSINKRKYKIKIDSGQVYMTNDTPLCVEIPYNCGRNTSFGIIDIVIAKALVICYKPKLIYTLY